jgi:predicted MFS family arabinose efflux permease
MLAMVSLGIGELIGASVMAKCVDKFGLKKCALINAGNIGFATLLVIVFIYRNEYGWLAYIMTLLWGYQDSSISIHLNSILGFEFEEDSEPFSIDALVESVMVFLFQVIQSFIVDRQGMIVYMIIVGIIGISASLSTYTFRFRKFKKQ